MDDAFDLQTRLAKIKEQAEPEAGRFEIIDALHPMRVVQRLDGLQLDQQQVLDQQVWEVLPTTTSL